MHIRMAGVTDRVALQELLVSVNGEETRPLAQAYIRCMFSGDYRKPIFVVAEQDGQIVGAAAFSEELFTVGTWGISWVSVQQGMRRQGIGQKLVEMCLAQIAKASGQKVSVILCTHPGKTGLYERMGFVAAGHDYEGGSYMLKTVVG